jgi:hypothetical protein
MGMRLEPLCGGVPPSRGRRGFLSSGIEVFSCPPEGGGKDPEKAGPGSVGYGLILPLQRGIQQGKNRQISPYFA